MDCKNSGCTNGAAAPDAFVPDAVDVFKALGDERRMRIMHQIADNPGICSCKVLEEHDMSQSTLSHHMKLLCSAGLVNCEKSGKWVHYTLNREGIDSAIESLRALGGTARTAE